LNLVAGRLTVPNIESRCNQLKLGHPPMKRKREKKRGIKKRNISRKDCTIPPEPMKHIE
jgi:hypothetical protein